MIALIEQETGKGGISRVAMCRALGVSRASLYRARRTPAPPDDVKLRDTIQHIALEMPGYGSRRIRAELQRRGCRTSGVHREDLLFQQPLVKLEVVSLLADELTLDDFRVHLSVLVVILQYGKHLPDAAIGTEHADDPVVD